jgi:ABC-type sugar transport system permease subunit
MSAMPMRVTARERRERLLFALLVAPNLLLLLVFTFWPMFVNIYYSLIQWDFISPVRRFVGLENYGAVLTDRVFHQVLANTLIFTVGAVVATLTIGLALALLLNQALRGRNLARAVLFAPTLLAGAAVAVVWTYIFDPRFGLIQSVLGLFELNSPRWLLDPDWALLAVTIVYIWKNVGYAAVIYLAGLQSIDKTLYEAATVDGADAWGRFWHVTLPGLSPVAFFLLVTSILACFQSFDMVRVMTQGGPVNATNTLVYRLYELGFVSFNTGQAGVLAVMIFLILLVVTIVQLRYVENRVQYA